MKNTYIAVTIQEHNKFYSWLLKVNENKNLLYALEIKNIVYAHLCKSKKHGLELVRIWNNQYKENKTNLY